MPSSAAAVSNAPAATNPSGHCSINRRDGLGARRGRRARRCPRRTDRRRGRPPSAPGRGTADPARRPRAISFALAAASRAPRSVKSFDDATPVRPRLTTRTRSPVSSRNVRLVDHGVREPGEPAPFVHEQDLDAVDAAEARARRRRPLGTRPRRSVPASAHPDLDVAEPGRRRPVSDAADLPRLALAAVRRAPHRPLLAAADRVARSPELRRDARVVRVLEHLRELAVLDRATRSRSRTGS